MIYPLFDEVTNIRQGISTLYYREPIQVIVVYGPVHSNHDSWQQRRDEKLEKLLEEFRKLTPHKVIRRRYLSEMLLQPKPEPLPAPSIPRAPVLLLRARGQAPRKAR